MAQWEMCRQWKTAEHRCSRSGLKIQTNTSIENVFFVKMCTSADRVINNLRIYLSTLFWNK